MNAGHRVKVLAKRLLARSGYRLHHVPGGESLEEHLMRVFSKLQINCVFDVGAYRGDYMPWRCAMPGIPVRSLSLLEPVVAELLLR